MKTLFAFCILYFLFLISYSQNVGIGTTTPNASAILDINSTTKGLLIPRMTNTQMNAIASPAAGLMVFNTTDSMFYVRKNSGWTKLIQPAATGGGWVANGNDIHNSNTGNVGIGVNTPSHSRLEINGSIGAAVAMFAPEKYGVTIEADNPEVGFNYYYYNGWKAMKAGYASVVGMTPSTGEFYIGNFTGNQAATDFGDLTGYRQNITLFQNGEFRIAGSSNFTHFYFGGNEDTYIRGGKDFSNVYINDITGGRVGIGTTAIETQTVLTVKGPQFYGGIDVTADGGPIGAIYAHGLNGTPALYLDGPLKVNTSAGYRTAYRLTTDYLNTGVDGYTTGGSTSNHYAYTDILVNNNLSNNDPNALLFYSFVDGLPEPDQDAFHSYTYYGGDNRWHIRYVWNKPQSGDIFSSVVRMNILIIKTN